MGWSSKGRIPGAMPIYLCPLETSFKLRAHQSGPWFSTMSGGAPEDLQRSLDVLGCLQMSLHVPECTWMSLGVLGCPRVSLDVFGCPWMSLDVLG
eukprot:9503608-Pyramimonas_sp.AAC.1